SNLPTECQSRFFVDRPTHRQNAAQRFDAVRTSRLQPGTVPIPEFETQTPRPTWRESAHGLPASEPYWRDPPSPVCHWADTSANRRFGTVLQAPGRSSPSNACRCANIAARLPREVPLPPHRDAVAGRGGGQPITALRLAEAPVAETRFCSA